MAEYKITVSDSPLSNLLSGDKQGLESWWRVC